MRGTMPILLLTTTIFNNFLTIAILFIFAKYQVIPNTLEPKRPSGKNPALTMV